MIPSLIESFRQLRFAAPFVAVLVSFVGETALAQTKPSIRPIDQTKITRKQPLRTPTNRPYWVSRADCVADDELTFNVQVTTPNTNNFQVWAGSADCTQLNQRQGDQAECWRVYQGQVVKSPANITIRAQDMVARHRPGTGSTGVPGDIEDCDSDIYIELGLYFMYVNDANEITSNTVKFTTGIDLEGPISPRLDSVSPADNQLLLKWTDSNPGEFAGYRIYCTNAVDVDSTTNALTLPDGAVVDGSVTSEAVETSDETTDLASTISVESISDAGAIPASTAANTDGATPPPRPTGCGGSALIEGEIPSGSYLCGTVDSYSAVQGYAKNLRNGRRYAVGLTAVDRLGNESGLSNVLCNSPREVFTFFEDYRNAGGGGGGGFCSVALIGSSRDGWPWIGLLGFGIGLALLRRMNHT
jgi:hypothetical protein